jgi:hypothetical protein
MSILFVVQIINAKCSLEWLSHHNHHLRRYFQHCRFTAAATSDEKDSFEKNTGIEFLGRGDADQLH